MVDEKENLYFQWIKLILELPKYNEVQSSCKSRFLLVKWEKDVQNQHWNSDTYLTLKIMSSGPVSFWGKDQVTEKSKHIWLAWVNNLDCFWCNVQCMTIRSDQIRSVAQSCLTLCDPKNRCIPGLPVHHQLLESTRTHIHWVSDAIQPSHPLSSPSPPAPNPSQHQGLFQWVNSLHDVAKVLEFQL